MIKYYAEIGLNHLGNEKKCFEMVKKAISSGVDGITIQIYPNKYYNNKKPFRKKFKNDFYVKLSKYLSQKKLILELRSLI